MDCKYQMEFKHDAQTIRRLSQTQYLSFEKKYIFLQLIIGRLFLRLLFCTKMIPLYLRCSRCSDAG